MANMMNTSGYPKKIATITPAAGVNKEIRYPKLPQNYTIKSIYLKLLGTLTASKVSGFNISLNNKKILPDLPGLVIQAINRYNGDDHYDPTIIEFQFWAPWAKAVGMERFGELDTHSTTSKEKFEEFSLGFTLDGSSVAGDAVEIWYVYDAYHKPDFKQIGFDGENYFRAWKQARKADFVVKENPIPLDYGDKNRANMRQVHLLLNDMSLGALPFTLVELKRNGVHMIEPQLPADVQYFETQGGKVPQAGLFSIDFVKYGREDMAESTLVDQNGKEVLATTTLKITGSASADLCIINDHFIALSDF